LVDPDEYYSRRGILIGQTLDIPSDMPQQLTGSLPCPRMTKRGS
jgi:hypothetical protein